MDIINASRSYFEIELLESEGFVRQLRQNFDIFLNERCKYPIPGYTAVTAALSAVSIHIVAERAHLC